MSLHLNLLAWEDGLLSVPVILQCDVVHYGYSIEFYCHLVAHHTYEECIPFSQFVVFHAGRLAGVLLVVVESARTHLSSYIGVLDILYLYLRSVMQIHVSIRFCSVGVQFPVYGHLEIAIAFFCT